MEGRVGFAAGTAGAQAAGGGAANAVRGGAPDPSNWMRQQQYQHVPVSSESKSSFSARGGLKVKQPMPQQQQQPTTSVPPVIHLFGSDGCLRSHLVQEVTPQLLRDSFETIVSPACSDVISAEAQTRRQRRRTYFASHKPGASMGLHAPCSPAARQRFVRPSARA
jgi:hypothetical protein